ncbi:MAG: hypothetical protein Q7J22_01445 [Candidatus Wolfebacteria bacterium]|nr:hypothetical protein [Candidatus Wolfebacteria bacterium]
MSKLTKKFLVDLAIALILLALLGAGVAFFSINLARSAEKLSESKKELESRSGAVQELIELQRAEKQFGNSYLNVLYNYIPQKDELINFGREMQTLADSEGLEFGFSFLGENPASSETLGSVKFSIQIAGKSQIPILNFIKKLQNFRFHTKLENITISNPEGIIKGQVFFRL